MLLHEQRQRLACMLVNNDTKLFPGTDPEEEWTDERCRLVRATMLRLMERQDPVDWITVTADLKEHGNLEKAGGIAFLTELVDLYDGDRIGYKPRACQTRVTEREISEIMDNADIVVMIGDVVDLAPSGKDFRGVCPFCGATEEPTFYVSPSRNIFHCFACAQGGSLFNFVMKRDNVCFLEAVRRVKERFQS